MAGKSRNLEIKAIDPDLSATLRAALEFGADDASWLSQRDTYFHAVQGRLKLREVPPAPAELIVYARAALPGPKVSLYRVVQVADHRSLIVALSDALGVRVVVEKARRLLLKRNVRIHLDRVEHQLREALGIPDENLVAHGYADLLTRRGTTGIRRLA